MSASPDDIATTTTATFASIYVRGEPLIVDDVTEDPRTHADAAIWQNLDINAFIHMPVRERGRTVAVFIVHDVQARRWTVEEVAFLRNVADRVEVGVARVRAEELQGVLNRELAHRLKNTLPSSNRSRRRPCVGSPNASRSRRSSVGCWRCHGPTTC